MENEGVLGHEAGQVAGGRPLGAVRNPGAFMSKAQPKGFGSPGHSVPRRRPGW